MPKTLINFRLSETALNDLQFCQDASKRRLAAMGYLPISSQSEIIEQALARLAKYYRSLKLAGEGGKAHKPSKPSKK